MNYIKIICSVFFFAGILGTTSYAQDKVKKVEEISFHTEGVCGMCKDRIESALDVKGIRFASWDKETGTTTVAYRPDHISTEEIHRRLAAAGHQTDLMPADSSSYQSLPGCCQYHDGAEKH